MPSQIGWAHLTHNSGIFTALACWADLVIESPCPSVCQKKILVACDCVARCGMVMGLKVVEFECC